MGELEGLVPRRVAAVARERLREEPVLLIQGPRSVGKSTLLASLARGLSGTLIDLDDPEVLHAFQADPRTLMDQPRPIFVDEYQRALEVLDYIKAQLNRPPTRPGRFVLTGSSRHESLPAAAQALTGRLDRLELLPLAQCEVEGAPGLLPRLSDQGEKVVSARLSSTTRAEYIRRVVRGGFPLAQERSDKARARWFDNYVQLTLERDINGLKRLRKAELLPQVLAKLAAQTGQVVNRGNVADALGVDSATVKEYGRLLEAVFLVRFLPAWGKTLNARAATSSKVHFHDSGVAARLLRLGGEKLDRRDPTSLTEFGHLVETFVVGELLKEVSWLDGVAQVGHWRTYDGEEVDLVVERDDGLVFAFEVKAGQRAAKESFAGLKRLRDHLGAAFGAGVVLHLGERAFRYDDRLLALPVDSLWIDD
ncbi:MAG: ATP-binding protein [Propionibacteriaceae bacterium]|nr:ATP-binding protein [Propionibacteriaceae bacterium]